MGRRLVGSYLRVGLLSTQGWRTFKLRQDFAAAVKVQMEDDITASVVVPREMLKGLNPAGIRPSVKLVVNCESRLFQRPDDSGAAFAGNRFIEIFRIDFGGNEPCDASLR